MEFATREIESLRAARPDFVSLLTVNTMREALTALSSPSLLPEGEITDEHEQFDKWLHGEPTPPTPPRSAALAIIEALREHGLEANGRQEAVMADTIERVLGQEKSTPETAQLLREILHALRPAWSLSPEGRQFILRCEHALASPPPPGEADPAGAEPEGGIK